MRKGAGGEIGGNGYMQDICIIFILVMIYELIKLCILNMEVFCMPINYTLIKMLKIINGMIS